MREKEFSWLAHNLEVKKKYRGEYIAIIGEQVVAHGEDLHRVVTEAERIEKNPLIFQVPKGDVLVL